MYYKGQFHYSTACRPNKAGLLTAETLILCTLVGHKPAEALTRIKAKVAHKSRVAGAEPVTELCDEGLQILSSLFRGVNVSEEVSQSIREELVTEVM